MKIGVDTKHAEWYIYKALSHEVVEEKRAQNLENSIVQKLVKE